MNSPAADATASGARLGFDRCIGPYVLRRELGRGGMSVVYEALDTRTGQGVALKLLALPPTLDAAETDALVARFEREARTVARLSHPNVIGIHEIGVVQGQHFLAMEFLRGQTLRQRLAQSRLPLHEAYAALSQVAGALGAVHAAGIVHRDVKASNVMLLPDGTAKLLDFGIARSQEEAEITSAGAVLGTPSYMAPEQVRGEPATMATDLWSLGVLSYEVLTSRLPFAGQVVANVLYQVLNSAPAPTPNLPKAVQKVLRRALDKDPALRYSSAGALVEALGSALPKSVAPKLVVPKPLKEDNRSVLRLAVPRWVQGAALVLLFLGAFSAAALHRHPVSARTRSVTEAAPAAPRPAVLPVQPLSPPVAVLPPETRILPATHQTLETRQTPEMRRIPEARQMSKAPLAAVRSNDRKSAPPLLPPSASPRILEGRRSLLPETAPTGEAVMVRRVPERRLLPAARLSPAPERPTAARPAPDTVQAQAAAQTQAAVQSVTLPANGDGDDPEAEARLRKSTWSQDTAPAAP